MGILIGVFCVAIFMDWRYYRIPNVCIFIGTAAGLVTAYRSCQAAGLLGSVGAAAVIFLAFYPFYLMGTLGAGDVKLFMMTGCYSACMEPNGFVHYMFVTMAVAGAISAVKMIVYKESRERLFYLMRYLRKVVMTGVVDQYQIARAQKRCVVRLSIPAFISLIMMCAGVYA